MRSAWAALGIIAVATGCVSTTSRERVIGDPTSVVRQEPLPGPPELEALLTRSEDAVGVELSRVRWCRREVVTSLRREAVESSRLGTGTAVTSSAIMVLGVAVTSVATFAFGGAILAIGLLQTGTSSTPLPDLETREPGQRVVCHREPAAGVVVQVFVSGARHQALTDAHGRLELRDVPPGAPRVFVDAAPVRFREEKARPRRVALRAPEDAAETPTAETPTPKPAEQPPPKLAPVVRPTDTSVLPPPPPPPPGVRLFPD